MAKAFRSPYGDASLERRRGGAYREPTPEQVVAQLRSGEHRAVAARTALSEPNPTPAPAPPPERGPAHLAPPAPEHRVTRGRLEGLADGVRSSPRWAWVAVPAATVLALMAVTGVVTDADRGTHEAVITQDTTPPPPTTAAHPTLPPTTAPVAPAVADPGPSAETPIANVRYTSCDDARAAGATPLRSGEPGYNPDLDRDHDGVACE
ncbi:MAG TPA: excalibur calcium-binding domain-containing protein [Acidimicrobiales bacterium]